VPSHPSVTFHPVGGWCSIFPFRDSFLSSFILRCRLRHCFPGQISFYSLQRGHTKCFSQVCMCTYIYIHRFWSNVKCFAHASTMQWKVLSIMHKKMPLQFCTPQMHSLIFRHEVSGTWTRRWFLRENLSLNCPGHPLQEQVNVAGDHSLYYILASFWYILWAV
jgi:hypothetical protein